MSTEIFYLLIFLSTSAAALVVFVGTGVLAKLTRRAQWGLFIGWLGGYAALLILQPNAWLFSDVVVLAVAAGFGVIIGGTLSSRGALVTFVVVAAMIDVLSFSGGLTAKIIADYRSGDSLLLRYLSISIPIGARVLPVVGVGDLIILGGLYVALQRLGYPAWERFGVPLLGVLSALIVGLLMDGIYAMPFIAAAVMLYVWLKPTQRTSPIIGEKPMTDDR